MRLLTKLVNTINFLTIRLDKTKKNMGSIFFKKLCNDDKLNLFNNKINTKDMRELMLDN